MGEKTYSIRRVSELLEIEAYVLRYYEKELKLDIHRNVNGHRIYTARDIELLKRIKEMREQGLELKAVKNVLDSVDVEQLSHMTNGDKLVIPQIIATKSMDMNSRIASKDIEVHDVITEEHINNMMATRDIDITNMNDASVIQFSMLMRDVMKDVLMEHDKDTREEIKGEIKEELKEELTQDINIFLEKKVREIEVAQSEKNEDYYYKLDEAMREMKKMKRDLTVIKESKEKVSFMKKLFGNKADKKYQNDLLEERQEL